MRRFGHLIALTAAALVGTTMIAGTAHAQSIGAAGGYYVAVPAAQPTRTSLVTRETPWTLQGNAYVAARAPERDTALCDAVARSTGALASFSVSGRAFDADQLARCNAHARGGAAAATSVTAR
ncbi:CC_3452 family protein [Sphingomonas sp.]|uniref:CC_3452 family protein n=1 Tax=Sphingomonas sp. TaxID=28214 RepID=UPI003CC5FBF5